MQTALALDAQRPAVTISRRLRGLLQFDAEAMAETYLNRHGDLYQLRVNGTTTLRMKPTQVSGHWLLVSWWSGHPYALSQKRVPQKIRSADLR